MHSTVVVTVTPSNDKTKICYFTEHDVPLKRLYKGRNKETCWFKLDDRLKSPTKYFVRYGGTPQVIRFYGA